MPHDLELFVLPDSCPERLPLALVPRRRLCRRCLARPAGFARQFDGLCGDCHKADVAARPKCRHCKTRLAARFKRGLCAACYEDHGVREQYPSESKGAPRNFGDVYRKSRLPAEPTAALPGTEAKVLVMMARAERGECLFHPQDGPSA